MKNQYHLSEVAGNHKKINTMKITQKIKFN